MPVTIRPNGDYQSNQRPGRCGSAIAGDVRSAQPLVGPTAPALRIPPHNATKSRPWCSQRRADHGPNHCLGQPRSSITGNLQMVSLVTTNEMSIRRAQTAPRGKHGTAVAEGETEASARVDFGGAHPPPATINV